MAHTPGPWRVHSEHADRIIVNGCCVYQVREMTTEDGCAGNGYGQPSPVDVRLMAAAPDLLLWLKALVHYDDGSSEQGSYGCELLRKCKAVIAAAEGRGE